MRALSTSHNLIAHTIFLLFIRSEKRAWNCVARLVYARQCVFDLCISTVDFLSPRKCKLNLIFACEKFYRDSYIFRGFRLFTFAALTSFSLINTSAGYKFLLLFAVCFCPNRLFFHIVRRHRARLFSFLLITPSRRH